MSFKSTIRIQKLQNKNGMMCLGILKKNERRIKPVLGGYYFENNYTGVYRNNQELLVERENYIKMYEKDTAELLKGNPKLKLVE